ncbi:MAG TPA: D-alanyl-D-alanine carboxypeptidase [Clostridiaceae bacterium]|nr:D-alanyl-D-alanine carboxypeptidase [Clostridiaceae bacterium]
MKRYFTFMMTLLVFVCNFISVSAEELNFNARAYILVDAKTGQVLYEHNATETRLYPASTTKIMTAILALELGDPDQIMTASKEAVYDIGKDGMNIGIMPGEQIPMRNLLDAMLISSANETANIIAENLCDTRQDFIDLMNEKAREIGALDTHFENPCGAHDDNHYTTAADMAKIAVYAMRNEEFRKIVEKKSYQMPPTNKHDDWPVLYSTNKLLRNSKNELFRVTGIKTGYTGPAGQNLVSSAINDEGMELIGVVMGVMQTTPTENSYTYSEKLLEYGFKNFALQKVIDKNQTVKSVYVSEAEDNTEMLDLVTSDELECVLPIDKSKWNISVNKVIDPQIVAPVQAGQVLGYIECTRNGTLLGKVDIIASKSIEAAPKNDINEEIKKGISQNNTLKNIITIILTLVAIFIIMRISLRIISRRIYASKRFK